jgi:hypothetical protein
MNCIDQFSRSNIRINLILAAIYVVATKEEMTPNPSFHRTLRIKPREAGQFRRLGR